MKHLSKYAISLCLAACAAGFMFASPLRAQDTPQTPHPSTGYPDIDLYYSQLELNTAVETRDRLHYLCQTTPLDTILAAYPIKGLVDRGGGISTFDYFSYLLFYSLESRERPAFVEELYAKVRREYKGKDMMLLADFVKGLYMFGDSLSYEPKMEWYEQVIRKAGDSNMDAVILREMFLHSFYSQRYARAFAYGWRLEQSLDRVRDDYWYKSTDYFDLGMAYYMFKDYDRALPLFHKSLSCRENPAAHDPEATLKAWNYLASYYHTRGDIDSATCYHRAILSSEEAREARPVHLAIAIGNLGRIEMEKGNYDAASATLEAALGFLEDHEDISFMSGVRTSLGECYLEKGDMKAAWEQITGARSVMDRLIGSDRQKRLKALYTLESRYYARAGQHDRAQMYQDSALTASSHYEQLTGQHFVVLGQQQLQEAEIELNRQQITRQRNIISGALAVLALICVALFVIVRLYRKKRAAYRDMVEKNRQWASSELLEKITDTPLPEPSAPDKDPPGENNGISGDDRKQPTQREVELTDRIHRMMIGQQLYRDKALSMDTLARMLNVTREAVSRAINRTTGKNFFRFLNEYRIKEAIQILSASRNQKVNFDDLAEQVGFNNRTTFHRAFKQITGLPPNEFKNKA